MANKQNIEFLSLTQLCFDPENPRFSRLFGDEAQPEHAVVERMIKNENVQELMGSIGEQDYFDGEPLLVSNNNDGTYIVVEGNRRLAALKLLSGAFGDDPLPSITSIRNTAKFKPESIPCIVFEQRRDILRYLGYRHITGAKRWDSLSKARYLNQLRNEFFSEVPQEEMLRSIAKEIGSRKDYVAQMLTGLAVYDNAKNNDFYGLQHVREEDVDFSLLTTALSYSDISTYVGLDSRTDINVTGLQEDKVKDIISWIYSQDQQGNTILGESRNLKKLAAVVANPDSVIVLKQQSNLETAYIFSEGPGVAFSKVLSDAEKKLRNAYAMLPDVKSVDVSNSEQVNRIFSLAEDLDSGIRKAIRRRREEA
ncbi:ParB N-terminal domain-containing protein [Aeromonas caviae]|uniref:ParB N-terminal domain-containing protein n=1 Tax=Aeromonas caviae TaxID=648 RepID=UPI0038CF7584